MWRPSNSARFFGLCWRQRLRFSLTSRIPTVTWVGRNDRIGIGSTIRSRLADMIRRLQLTTNLRQRTFRLSYRATGVANTHFASTIPRSPDLIVGDRVLQRNSERKCETANTGAMGPASFVLATRP